jgi:hypothetical protein
MWESRHKASPLIPHLGQFSPSQRSLPRRKTRECCLFDRNIICRSARAFAEKGSFSATVLIFSTPGLKGCQPLQTLDSTRCVPTGVTAEKCEPKKEEAPPFEIVVCANSVLAAAHLGAAHHLSQRTPSANIYLLALWSRSRHLQSNKECRARDLCSECRVPAAFSTRLK